MVLEKTLESPLDCKEIQPVHLKGDQSWVFIGRTDVKAETPNTLATWFKELTHWKRPWCWEGLGAGGEGDDRWWDGWMASPTWWTWVWVNSGSWWWTGRPGVLQFMVSQTVRYCWVTELNWTLTHKLNLKVFNWLSWFWIIWIYQPHLTESKTWTLYFTNQFSSFQIWEFHGFLYYHVIIEKGKTLL